MTKQQKDQELKKKLEKAKKEAELKEAELREAASKEPAQSELEKVRQELNQMTELAKRTMADLINLRRRQEEERTQLVLFSNADLIKQILPILDNLDRAKQHIPAGAEEWAKGLEIAINQLHQVLKDNGVTPIETGLGKPFNPEYHEVVLQGPGEKNIILEEIEKGYVLGSRVIKHAKIKVGNGESQEQQSQEKTQNNLT